MKHSTTTTNVFFKSGQVANRSCLPILAIAGSIESTSLQWMC